MVLGARIFLITRPSTVFFQSLVKTSTAHEIVGVWIYLNLYTGKLVSIGLDLFLNVIHNFS